MPLTDRPMAIGKQREQFLDKADITAHQGDTGKVNWLAITTHPEIATAQSLNAGYNAKPVEQCKLANKHMYRYLKGTIGNKLQPTDKTGLRVTTDSDWCGLHALTGETRSRSGKLIFYNGMPVDWRSGLQPTRSLQVIWGS